MYKLCIVSNDLFRLGFQPLFFVLLLAVPLLITRVLNRIKKFSLILIAKAIVFFVINCFNDEAFWLLKLF